MGVRVAERNTGSDTGAGDWMGCAVLDLLMDYASEATLHRSFAGTDGAFAGEPKEPVIATKGVATKQPLRFNLGKGEHASYVSICRAVLFFSFGGRCAVRCPKSGELENRISGHPGLSHPHV